MRTETALFLLASLGAVADASKHAHEHLHAAHKRHHAHHEMHQSKAERGESGLDLRAETTAIKKRSGQCPFPTDAGLVQVTPDGENAGWAQAPDMPCVPGKWCPYACPPGQLMAQWDPSVTSYSYPGSTHGGMYCDENGDMQLGFPENEHCIPGEGTVAVKNSAGGVSSWCQTVLPGYEDMLIPTPVTPGSQEDIAVPGTSYYAGSAAHYYINAPGVTADDGCAWGSPSHPWGNWAPYVAGANVDDSGNTFIKLGINPIQLEPESNFQDTIPTWGLRINCDGCNGMPCAIDPTRSTFNEMSGSNTIGAGGAAFCVVTAPKGVKAVIEVFDTAGGSDSSSSSGSSSSSSPSSAKSSPSPSSSPAPSSTSHSSTSSSSSSTSTSTSSTSSTSSSTTTHSSTSSSSSSSSAVPTISNAAHMLFENATTNGTTTSSNSSSSATSKTASSATSLIGSATSSVAAAASSTKSSGASAMHLSIASVTMSFLIISLMMAFS